jgi:hypothetical protein
VFFLDPDGMKFEGMKWGERHANTAHAKQRKTKAAVKRTHRSQKT